MVTRFHCTSFNKDCCYNYKHNNVSTNNIIIIVNIFSRQLFAVVTVLYI